MFQCIRCSKQATVEEGNEQAHQTETVAGTEGGTLPTNQAIKSLTSQLRDMAVKFTGAHKQNRSSGAGPSTYQRGPRPYEYDNNSEGAQGISGSQTLRRNKPIVAYAAEVHDADDDIMWTAQVEPGVHITFMPLSNGGNDLRKIRFNCGMFDRHQAQEWWTENFDRVMELYNVKRIYRQALNTPNAEDVLRDTPPVSREPSGSDSPVADWLNNGRAEITMDRENNSQNMNAAEIEGEWIERDVPGVFLTIRQLVDGSRELRHVRFSRQRFGEDDAKNWWEENRERIQAQYM